MVIFPSGVNPVFLGEDATALKCAAQVKFFDVYYTNPPVVGFHVTASGNECP